jgi:glycosyltransferase involved in cell wall biosynthesis
MRILWVAPNFLHPTTKGGQIRTLGILRWLSRWHEVHYVAFEDPASPEGPERAGEYCYRAYPFQHNVVSKTSPRFALELAAGVFSRLPLAISRYQSAKLKIFLEGLQAREKFDCMVIDFLVMSASCPAVERSVLFQHNVETMIWRRHAETARDPLRKVYFGLQARRMERFEAEICRRAGHVIAVSKEDAGTMRSMFGVSRLSEVPTGVDIEYFARPAVCDPGNGLVFVGSMDWLPNVDGVSYFVERVLPLIHAKKPECTFTVVGRTPGPEIVKLGQSDARIKITGTVADVRPYFWGSAVSVVPLRIGGGTRLKIYEAMAAGVPVVSTTVGAEGLDVRPAKNILIGDTPEKFAAHCIALLDDKELSRRQSAQALKLVEEKYSWERVARRFEEVLEQQQH